MKQNKTPMRLKNIIIIMLFMTTVSVIAQDRAYIEPQFTVGFNVQESNHRWDLEGQDVGVAIESYNPVKDNYSVTVTVYFLRSKIETVGGLQTQALNRYGFKVGLRFYL